MFESPYDTFFVEFLFSNGRAFFLDSTSLVGSWIFDEYILSGEESEIWIWSIIFLTIAVS